MVLVAYKLSNAIAILQTKLRYREGHEARRGGLEAMPLDQHIEGGHGEREAGVEIRPASVHDLFQMALRHEVARLIVWQAVLTKPVVPSAVSYVVRQQGNALSNAHGQSTHSHPTDACTARERRICQHQVEMGLDGWYGEHM